MALRIPVSLTNPSLTPSGAVSRGPAPPQPLVYINLENGLMAGQSHGERDERLDTGHDAAG